MVLIMLYRPAGLWPSPKHEDKIAKTAKRAGKKPSDAPEPDERRKNNERNHSTVREAA